MESQYFVSQKRADEILKCINTIKIRSRSGEIEVIVTGSCAVFLMLFELGQYELASLIIPNDIDLLVITPEKKISIQGLVIEIDNAVLSQGDDKSVTFVLDSSYFNKIDITTYNGNISYTTLNFGDNAIKIIYPTDLSSFYNSDDLCKKHDVVKINALALVCKSYFCDSSRNKTKIKKTKPRCTEQNDGVKRSLFSMF